MLLQYSFPNFLASQDVTKITRDLNCKYMEAPRMVTPPPPSSRLTSAKNPPRGKMAVEKDVEGPFSSPPTPPISFMLSRQSIGDVKRAFDDTCASLLAKSPLPPRYWPNSKTVPRKGNGSWQEIGIESNVIQLTATISPSDRIEARLEIYGVQSRAPPLSPSCWTIYTEPRFSVNTTVNLSRKEAWYTVLKQL